MLLGPGEVVGEVLPISPDTSSTVLLYGSFRPRSLMTVRRPRGAHRAGHVQLAVPGLLDIRDLGLPTRPRTSPRPLAEARTVPTGPSPLTWTVTRWDSFFSVAPRRRPRWPRAPARRWRRGSVNWSGPARGRRPWRSPPAPGPCRRTRWRGRGSCRRRIMAPMRTAPSGPLGVQPSRGVTNPQGSLVPRRRMRMAAWGTTRYFLCWKVISTAARRKKMA
jgi:hypothetical protein